MNHEDAIDTQAAERYLLGELATPQRDAFEEHFFDCALCAADIQDGAALAAGIRRAERQENPFLARRAARRRRNVTPLAAAASLLVALLAYQQFGVIAPLRREIESERAPRLVPVHQLGQLRTANDRVIDVNEKSSTLDFDIPPPERPSPSYTYTIVDGRGKAHGSNHISAAQARETIHLNIYPATLGKGDFKLQVTDAGGAPVVTYEFTIR